MDGKLNRTFLTDLLGFVDTENEPHKFSVTNFAIFLNISTILFNSFVIFIISTHTKISSQSSYLQVINTCIANFLNGIVVIPFSIYSQLHAWNFSQSTCHFWIIMDVYLPFVTILIVIMIFIEKLVMLTKCKQFCSRSKIFVTLELLLPWTVAMFIIFPIWIEGSFSIPGGFGYCFVHLSNDAALLSHIMTFFLPSWISIILTIIILIKRCRGNSSNERLTRNNNNTRIRSENNVHQQCTISLISLFFSNYSYLVLWFPHQFVSVLLIFCERCSPPHHILVGISWLGALTSALAPLLWFTDKEIRKRAKYLLCSIKLCQKRSSFTSTDSNEFELLDSFDRSTTCSTTL